jgi:hypothetical protein
VRLLQKHKFLLLVCVSLGILIFTGCSYVNKESYEQYLATDTDMSLVTTDGISVNTAYSLNVPDGYNAYKVGESDLLLLNSDNSIQVLVQNTNSTSIEQVAERYELNQSTGEVKISGKQALVYENGVSDGRFDSYTYLLTNQSNNIIVITTYYEKIDYEDSILQVLDNFSF